MFKIFLKDESGATAVEYALIILMIVLAIISYVLRVENDVIHVMQVFGAIILIIAVCLLIPRLIPKSAKQRKLAVTKRSLIAASKATPSHFQAKNTSEITLREKPIYDVLSDIWRDLKLKIDVAAHKSKELEKQNIPSTDQDPSKIEGYYEDSKKIIKRCRQFFIIDKLDWTEDLLPTTQVSRYLAIIEKTPSLEKKIKSLQKEREVVIEEHSEKRTKLFSANMRLKRNDTKENQKRVADRSEAKEKILERERLITTELDHMKNRLRELEELKSSFLEGLVPFDSVPDGPSKIVKF